MIMLLTSFQSLLPVATDVLDAARISIAVVFVVVLIAAIVLVISVAFGAADITVAAFYSSAAFVLIFSSLLLAR